MCTLIVTWTWDQDPFDPPCVVVWGDGRPATQEDYAKHRYDTHEIVETEDGIQKQIFVWLIADIRYDAFARRWFLLTPDEDPLVLQLSDQNATDAQIISELDDLPRIWNARIWRDGSCRTTAEIEQARGRVW